jgi:hypothetical protein
VLLLFTVTITRLAPELFTSKSLELRFVSQNATGVRDRTIMPLFTPQFQPGILWAGYSVTLPYVWKKVGLWFNTTITTNTMAMNLSYSILPAQPQITATNMVDSVGTLSLSVPGFTEAQVFSPNDGVYVFAITILPPDIQGVTLYSSDAYAYPGNPGFSTMEFGSWDSTVYNYFPTPSYIITSIQLWVNFTTPGSAWYEWNPLNSGYGPIVMLDSQVSSIEVPVPEGVSYLRLSSRLDGVYVFKIGRQPDLLGMRLQSTWLRRSVLYTTAAQYPSFTPPAALVGPLQLYLAQPSGPTAGKPAAVFTSVQHFYNDSRNITVPFGFSRLDLFLSTKNFSVTMNLAYPVLTYAVNETEVYNATTGLWDPVNVTVLVDRTVAWFQYAVTNFSAPTYWDLQLGENLAQLDIPLDGRYEIQVWRLEADVLSVGFNPLPATAGWTQPLPPVLLTPGFVRNQRDVLYNSTVITAVGSVQLVIDFLTPNSLVAISKGVIYPLVSGQPSTAIPLTAAVYNVITLVSLLDQNYTLSIFREPIDTTNFTLTWYNEIGTPTLVVPQQINPSTFISGVYQYTVTVPWGAYGFSVEAESESHHAEYIALSNGGQEVTLFFQTWNKIDVNNTHDG